METKKKRNVVGIVVNVLLWIVIVIAALFTIFTLATKGDGTSTIGGYIPMTVLSDSMKPEFAEGDLILVKKPESGHEFQLGEIVSFYTIIEGQSVINTHRIVEIVDNDGLRRYVTKGDANSTVDEKTIIDGDIIGISSGKVPVLGPLFKILKSKVGFLVIIILPLLAFFIYQAYNLILVMGEMKKEAVAEANEKSREQIEAELRAKIETETRAKIEAEQTAAGSAEAENKDQKVD